MGTPEFSVPCLKALVENGMNVVGVFTQPDRPKGRGNKLTPSPVKTFAESAAIPVFQPEKIRFDGAEDLRNLEPRASSRVETGMSGIFLSCSKGVKDPLEVPVVRCD